MSAQVPIQLGTQIEFNAEGSANVIVPGTTINCNNSWCASPNQEYILVAQSDGNVVWYQLIGATAPAPQSTITVSKVWATGTNARRSGTCQFRVQADGNLVLYSPNGTKIWATGTNGVWPAGLHLQNDGNLVLYQIEKAWASNTNS